MVNYVLHDSLKKEDIFYSQYVTYALNVTDIIFCVMFLAVREKPKAEAFCGQAFFRPLHGVVIVEFLVSAQVIRKHELVGAGSCMRCGTLVLTGNRVVL